MYLLKNIQDKQIIDLRGNKIVRVNDIVLQDKDGFYITGVDIGILGILRWIKLEKYFHRLTNLVNYKAIPKFLSWADIQPLELARGKVKLKKEETRLEKLHPEDLADYLEKTNVINTKRILRMLDEKFAAKVIGKLNINFQTSLFRSFSPDRGAKVIASIDPDEAVDILLTIPSKKRIEIISLLSEIKKKEINHLLQLSRTPIGELITTEYLTTSSQDSAQRVIEKIKAETGDFSYLSAVYVLNNERQLIGVFGTHELLLQDINTPVYKFMFQNIIVIHLSTPVEIAVKKMLKYRLSSIPVIDQEKRILGIVTLDDATEFILPKIR